MSPKQALILVFLTVVALQSNALTEAQCREAKLELKAMRDAQKSLLTNMVSNNQTMASTLEEYSAQLKTSAKIRRPISAQDISSLHQSAAAFRAHGARESKLISKFNQASDRLFARIDACLSEN